MRKISRIVLFMLFTVMVLWALGCGKKENSNQPLETATMVENDTTVEADASVENNSTIKDICYENSSIAGIIDDLENPDERLRKYDSPYTICYKNSDGTYALYVFSSPIQYKANYVYEIIDNSLISSDKEGFAFENRANDIKTYFPDKISGEFLICRDGEDISFSPNFDVSGFAEGQMKTICNMQNDQVQAVVYESQKMDLCFYPTKTGIKLEIIIKEKIEGDELDFSVKTSADDFEAQGNGYVVLKALENKQALIYASLQKNAGETESSIDYGNVRMCKEKDGLHVYFLINDTTDYPIHMDPSFELYRNNIPDSTVYSDFPMNSYLNNYAAIGDSSKFGEGWHFLRLRLQALMVLSPETINEATFHLKCLFCKDSNGEIEILKNNEQWSSTRMQWDSRIRKNEKINKYVIGNGELQANITDYVKESFLDSSSMIESQGIMLKSKEDECVVATSENAMYTPYVRLVLTEEPLYFKGKENINEELSY